MAVAYVSSSTAQANLNSTSSLSLTAPSTITDGNLLICAINTPTVANGGPTPSLPAGFTAFPSSPFTGGTGVVLTVGWKVASSESGPYSIGLSGSTGANVAALMLNYSGAEVANSGFVGAGSATSLAVAGTTGIDTGGVSVMIGGAAPDSSTSSLTVTLPSTSRVASFYAHSGVDWGQALAASESSATASGNMTVGTLSELGEITIVLNPPNTTGPWTYSSTGTWIAPAGVTAVKVECWGGGGAGGGGSVSGAAGGGGAGGSYARVNSLSVTPGNSYTVTVGAGGQKDTTPSANGATHPGSDSWFSTSGTVIAKGGAGGGDRSTSGAGTAGAGSSTGCIGDQVYAGGSGAAGVSASIGGGGGGAAGPSAVGGNASGSTAGTGNSPGADGTAGRSAANATDASAPGGGGGGARATSTTDRLGGNGGAGQVLITNVTPTGSNSVGILIC